MFITRYLVSRIPPTSACENFGGFYAPRRKTHFTRPCDAYYARTSMRTHTAFDSVFVFVFGVSTRVRVESWTRLIKNGDRMSRGRREETKRQKKYFFLVRKADGDGSRFRDEIVRRVYTHVPHVHARTVWRVARDARLDRARRWERTRRKTGWLYFVIERNE